jgi:hypothetical protein
MKKRILCTKHLPIHVHSGSGTNKVVCVSCGCIVSDHLAIMGMSGIKCPQCAAEQIDNSDQDVWEKSLEYKDHLIQFIHVGWIGKETRRTNILVDGRTRWFNIPFRYRVYAALLMHEFDKMSLEDANRMLDNAGY